jgi:hypothetical protein
VCLVYDDQIEGVQFAGPLVDRLDTGEDHRVLGVAASQAGRVDAEAHLRADRAQLVGRLLQQFLDVGQHQDAATPLNHGVFADRGQ